VRFTIPYPPTANKIWRTVDGHVVLSAEGQAYRRRVKAALIDQAESLGFVAGVTKPATFDAKLDVTIGAYTPDARRRDVDNLLKPTLDALQYAGAYRDDYQIDRLEIVRRGIDRPAGRLEISIEAT